MPILFQIVVEGNTGSTGTTTEALGDFVMQKGWQSYIAFGRFPRPSKSQTIRIGSDFNTLLHILETRLFDRHCLSSRNATKKLICQIKEIKPDIILLHHLHGYYINIKILFDYLSTANIPVVWTFHDCWSVTGHCCHFDFAGCEKWKSECNQCPQIKEYPASLFIDRSKKNYYLKKKLFTSVPKMVILSVSNWLNHIVEQSFFKDTPKQTIYNGLDTDLFKPTENAVVIKNSYKVDNCFMLLGVAYPWGRKKGFSDFLKLSKYLNPDERIVLVGLNDNELKMLPENIIGLRKTENKQQLVDLYNATDIFLNLSIEETFGLTTAEAMSCGTPVILYNATACPEIIDTETGIAIEKSDINSLVKAISIIRAKGKKFYSIKCRERVLNNFDKKEKNQEYLNLFERLLK